MEKEIIIESVEDLYERWEMLKYSEGVEDILITEFFPKQGRNEYVVLNLSMEIEDDYVMCSDHFNEIVKNNSPLMMFLRQHLLRIILIPIANGYRERLEFVGDGIVFIEKFQ